MRGQHVAQKVFFGDRMLLERGIVYGVFVALSGACRVHRDISARSRRSTPVVGVHTSYVLVV